MYNCIDSKPVGSVVIENYIFGVACTSCLYHFSILLCLTLDDFTRQVESAATQWVKGLATCMHTHVCHTVLTYRTKFTQNV